MIDSVTKKPLRVSPGSAKAGPYLGVPLAQLDEVRSVLDRHAVEYSVDELAISTDDKPFVIYVQMRRGTDPQTVQQLLDAAS